MWQPSGPFFIRSMVPISLKKLFIVQPRSPAPLRMSAEVLETS
jgi:hypothetical protein